MAQTRWFTYAPRMNKAIGIALLVGGIALVIFGLNESNSLSSDVNRVFTGNPTDRAMWMMVGGGVAAVAGLVMTLRRSKT
jgi:hypothetical protein